jgi:beta-galactosidase
MLSRRRFLGQISAASAYAWSSKIHAEEFSFLPAGIFPYHTLPGPTMDRWKSYGRIVLQHLQESVIIQDGFTTEHTMRGDCEFSLPLGPLKKHRRFRFGLASNAANRDSRYVFALRGGDNDDLYLARYGADGAAKFLGIAPLGFHPIPGDWYKLRAITCGNRILIFLDQETIPRINVTDDEAPWTEGGVSLGGGWLPVEFRGVTVNSLDANRSSAVDELENTTWKAPAIDKSQLRPHQRGAYRPIELPPLDQPRVACSLDGNWLFLPDQELTASVAPQSEDLDDRQWHVMDVPNFWTPTLSWLHDETGFPKLQGLSSSKGICDKFYEEEFKRLDGYTFDWRATKGGWYRQYLNLPALISNRRFEVCFDAIAKVAENWVNGVMVDSHIGMFGEVRCDVTHALKPGKNVLAVHVVGHLESHPANNEVVGVAVTVEVTSEMLTSLPHGMYPNDASGIWQPVTLLVTNEVCVQDVYPRNDDGHPTRFYLFQHHTPQPHLWAPRLTRTETLPSSCDASRL